MGGSSGGALEIEVQELDTADDGSRHQREQAPEQDNKPAWRDGSGWMPVIIAAGLNNPPAALFPSTLDFAFQHSTVEAGNGGESTTPGQDSTLATVQAFESSAARSLIPREIHTAEPVSNHSGAPTPSDDAAAAPLAFKLSITPPERPSPAQPPSPLSVTDPNSEPKTRPSVEMAPVSSPPPRESAALEPKPAQPPEATPTGGQSTRPENRSEKMDSSGANQQNPGGGHEENHSQEAVPSPHEKIQHRGGPDLYASPNAHHITDNVRSGETARAPHVSEATPLAEPGQTNTAPAVTSLRLRLESTDSSTPVDLTVSERSGQVRIMVRDAELARNVELREHLPDLLRRLEQAGYRSEAGGDGVGQLRTESSPDAGSSSNHDQQRQQEPQQGRRDPREDSGDNTPAHRQKQDRHRWQTAWLDMATSE